jgi:NCAIR mutase (PurE)-related protein
MSHPDPETSLERVLARVAAGDLDPATAAETLRGYVDLGFAHVDTDRARRVGFPEVIFGQGKAPAHIAEIARALYVRHQRVLVTRVAPEVAQAVVAALPGLPVRYAPIARALVIEDRPAPVRGQGTVLIVAAGTSDLPVAEEAALTASLYGNPVERLTDVGVAGLHRLLAHREQLRAARVLIVVAGMEGALPSVVAGLVSRPVIAVPTSVGYGASFGGLSALLGMLNSCAAGVTVVNIDNGFGAAYAASLINLPTDAEPPA